MRNYLGKPRSVPRPEFTNRFRGPRLDLELIQSITQKQWQEEGEREVLRLAREMAARVPAYRSLLEKQGNAGVEMQSIQDFKKLPIVDKDSYLRTHPLQQLCWDGQFDGVAWTIYATSGSTGEPFYFPHTSLQDEQYALYAELYLRSNFNIDKKTTLYINAFPLGAWIGGIFTLKAISMIAERGNYPLSIINTGIHKAEIIKAVRKFGDHFDQVIIGCYGPFLKDALDDGVAEGLDWKRYNLGFIFAAEGFSESFRDYVGTVAGAKNVLTSTVNQYGTVDLGTMSYETPLAILIRRTAVENPRVYKSLFKDSIKLPTFTQYIPQLFYFEEVDGTLICSAWGGIPLVRYNLKDSGGVYTFGEVSKKMQECGIDLSAEARKYGIPVWEMPFVYVYERNDFSISFYAFQVYPATVRRALENADMRKALTGKFTMTVKHNKRQEPYIEINVEMKAGILSSRALKQRVGQIIGEQLLKESSEFRETWKHKGRSIQPRIVCWPYEHERFFKLGSKQKWVSK